MWLAEDDRVIATAWDLLEQAAAADEDDGQGDDDGGVQYSG